MRRSILLIILLVTCCITAGLAEKPGEVVTITFEVTDNSQNAISARVGMLFDSDVFEFVSAKVISPEVRNYAPTVPTGKFGLLSLKGISLGPIGSISLRIRETAPAGKYEIQAVVDSVYNTDSAPVQIKIQGGSVSVDHVWDDGRVTVEATCYSEGLMTYYCFYCDKRRTEIIPVTAHAEADGIETTPATCTADGVMIFPCRICGDVLRTITTPAYGHAEGDTVVILWPTATSSGAQVVQCAHCGKTIRTESIPAGAEGYVRLPGDANTDGAVNIFDALIILQRDVGWETAVNVSNADVNADENADIFDALLILQYDVGWDVVLK